jgi:hypothetical protein
MKKAAIELSANFIIVMVLSAALMVGGFFLIKNLFFSVKEIQLSLTQETDAQIEQMLSSGSRVAIPISTKEAERGKLTVFGLGILNSAGGFDDFKFEVKFSAAYDTGKELIHPTNPDSWLAYSGGIKRINKNEDQKFAIGIKVPKNGAPSGEYVFNVNVSQLNSGSWQPYDDLRKIVIKI